MLTSVEKMVFVLLGLFTVGSTYAGLRDMFAIINRGQKELYFENLPARLWKALMVYITQVTTLKTRRTTSLFHLGVVWGFTYYFLVNVIDGFEGFIRDWRLFGGEGLFSNIYRGVGDVLTIAVLVGVVYFILRRFVLPNRKELTYHDNVLLHPKVKAGAITQDSMIVAGFILLHVGARFLGQSVQVAAEGPDLFRPFATLVSPVWGGMSDDSLRLLEHLFWWVALGGILLFTPYFVVSKHAHLFMAPINFLTRPKRTSLGELEPLNFEDDSIEQFGANKLTDLTKTNILDGFACIMCNRCQDVCPAYVTGKELSPAA
jgi:hypothetical protein